MINLQEVENRLDEVDHLIKFALLHTTWWKRRTMFAANVMSGNSYDVMQQVYYNLFERLSRKPINAGFSTAIVNHARWTVYRIISRKKYLLPPQTMSDMPLELLPAYNESPEFWLDLVAIQEKLKKALNTLTYRERGILEMRYGLKDGYSYTLKNSGDVFGITRERVRQIEGKAIRRLRHSSRSATLQGWAEVYLVEPDQWRHRYFKSHDLDS